VRFDRTPDEQIRYEAHRRALHGRTTRLIDLLRAEDLVLSVDQIRYFSHWITPAGAPKRFDTRFFLARAPEGQVYAHDDQELIGSEWIQPAEALARHRLGEFAMIDPTIRSLQDIGRFATCDDLLAAHDLDAAGARSGPG
jgi:hypothetical protein